MPNRASAARLQDLGISESAGTLEDAQMNLTRYQTLQQQKSIAAQQAEDQVYVVQQDKGTVLLDQANVETATINLG
jgi:membrane fusion protein, multidrug efflux system